MTLPLIHLLQQDDERRRARSSATSSRTPSRDRRAVGRAAPHAARSTRRSTTRYRRAVEFAERAKKPLYAFPPSSERDALLALPDYVLSRDR